MSLASPPAAPVHGFRGDASPAGPFTRPMGWTVAVSREAGAQGSTIARKVGAILGWQVFDQELLDFLLADETGRTQLLTEIPEPARDWATARLDELQRTNRLAADPTAVDLFRLVFAIAARGNAVVVGRGTGYLLPADHTLHVRVVAPFEARVHSMAQGLRLTREEAEREVRERDDRRTRFVTRTVLRDAADPTGYDLVINSAQLGVGVAAQTVGWAVRTKQQYAEIGATEHPGDADPGPA